MRPHVTKDEALLMFHFWFKMGKNVAEVARKFKRSRGAVNRTKAEYDWDAKAIDMQDAESKALIKAQTKEVESDWQIVNAAIKKVADHLLDKDTKIKGRFSDLVQLIRIKLELTGDLPTQGTGDTNHTINHINNFFNQMSPEEIDEHDNDLGAIFANRSTHSRI